MFGFAAVAARDPLVDRLPAPGTQRLSQATRQATTSLSYSHNCSCTVWDRIDRPEYPGPIRDRSQNCRKAPMARQNRYFGLSAILASLERQGIPIRSRVSRPLDAIDGIYRADNKLPQITGSISRQSRCQRMHAPPYLSIAGWAGTTATRRITQSASSTP